MKKWTLHVETAVDGKWAIFVEGRRGISGSSGNGKNAHVWWRKWSFNKRIDTACTLFCFDYVSSRLRISARGRRGLTGGGVFGWVCAAGVIYGLMHTLVIVVLSNLNQQIDGTCRHRCVVSLIRLDGVCI